MGSDRASEPTKVWHCTHCGSRNLTSAVDVFSDQCRTCTEYNDIDWEEPNALSFGTLSEATEQMTAD